MSVPDVSADAENEPLPEGLVQAGFYPTQAAGLEHGLVVLAMGEPCWLVPTGGGHGLFVEPAIAAVAGEQLTQFDRESAHWPPKPAVVKRRAPEPAPVSPMVWALAVCGVFWAQDRWPAMAEAGALDAGAVFDGNEGWRTFTALFLHADLGHLVSNLASGIFVFSVVVSMWGGVRGWLLLTVASTGGNVAAAALNYPEPYRSIGASTAVFAGLGLLTGRSIRAGWGAMPSERWRKAFIPFAAGVAVLGLFGAGGVHVDVLAHATGFVAGLALGLVAEERRRERTRSEEISRSRACGCVDRG